MRFLVAPLLFTLTWVSTACVTETTEHEPRPLLPDNELNYHLMVVAQFESNIRMKGFATAAPPNTTIGYTDSEGTVHNHTSDEDGAFDFTINAGGSALPERVQISFQVQNDSVTHNFRVRQLESDLTRVPQAPHATGQIPNDILITADTLWVLASADALLQSFELSPEDEELRVSEDVYFPLDDHNRGANPYQMALHDSEKWMAVSLFAQQAVVIVNTDTFEEVARFPLSAIPAHQLPEPLQVQTPVDADGDGLTETTITQMQPRFPQVLLWRGDTLWAATTNYLQFATGPQNPAVLAPGTLLGFDWSNQELSLNQVLQLEHKNPQDLKVNGDEILIACSGVASTNADGIWQLQEPGALLSLDINAEQSIETVMLFDDFSPSTVNLTSDSIVIGNSIEANFALIPLTDAPTEKEVIILEATTATDSVFTSLDLGGGLLVVAQFGTDALWFYDLSQKELNPWPFTSPLVISPQLTNGIFKGLLRLQQRPGKPGVDYSGWSVMALTSLSSEVVPLDFFEVMGP